MSGCSTCHHLITHGTCQRCAEHFPPPALLAAADSSLSVTFHLSQLPAHLMLSKNLEVLSNPSQECMGRGSGCSWEHWAQAASLPCS